MPIDIIVSRPTVSEIREFLRYDTDTGKLYWRHRADKYFTASRYARSWNSKNADKEAGKLDVRGYRIISIHKHSLYAHRIVWALVRGEWPTLYIDHVDQDKTNNRIENLREVVQQVNLSNSRMRSNNTSGFTGVHRKNNRWVAAICCKGSKLTLGSFEKYDDAVKVRTLAQTRLGFSQNHGRAR